ncbi:protein FAR1-RELATED SEQUENCE 9-like [Pistacia vera]|uniref:protein FAR1-RELATED SEQUENCE 9-like n=1 Tax=Pistacia vera TaxID=55513 RepID=UPI001263745A|nr:protein FAR1-RELATED SEQUENCE 9-like [Pistacia vera]
MSGADHNSPDADIWSFMFQTNEELDEQNLEELGFSQLQNDGKSDKQNVTGTSMSESGFEWDSVHSFVMADSNEGLSVGSEAHSRISTQGPDVGIIPGKIRDQSVRNSLLEPHNESVEDSMKHLCISGFVSLPSESDEADLPSQSQIDRDDMQSESTINLIAGPQELNFQVPELGMPFSSEDEAYNFYKNYAEQIGFNVRKGRIRRLANGTIRKRELYCSNEGFRSRKQSDKTKKFEKEEKRTGCKAMVQFTNDNGIWKITRVFLDHNHAKCSNQGHIMFPSSNISLEDASIHTVDEAAMVNEEGVANSAESYLVDRSNYLRIEKINVLPPEDGQSLIDFLKHLQLEDPSFFYTVQVDGRSHLTNFFWRDGRSKIDYEYFGDVLILDRTFRIERFDIICAPFLGVNHHRQYVLFGCAFLLDDSMDSFVWLFRSFVEAMGMRRPKTIFTDECEGISDALKVVLSGTQHRLGMWYITQNARKNLYESFKQPGFEELFNKYLFCSSSEEEFCSLWDDLLVTYNLQDNSWLKTLHMMRGNWSHVFSKIAFSAGIESLQGRENIINVFHNLMTETITLPKFVQQYLRSAEQWRREELKEDFHSRETEPTLILRGNDLEKQAAEVYTLTIYKLFQEELLGCLSLAVEQIADDGKILFKLTEGAHKESIVEFNYLESKVTCSCKKYESIGILCVHSLRVLISKNIFHIPSEYILKRWTKSAKDGMVSVDHKQETTTHGSPRSLNLIMSRLMHKALRVVDKSVEVEGSWKMVEDHLDLALREIEYVKTKKTGYLKGKDAELHDGDINDTDYMEIQTNVLNPPSFSEQELSKHSMTARLKRKQENEVRQTERKSSDDAIGATQVGDDLEPRARFGIPHCVGESWQQATQLSFSVTGNMQERMPRQKKISKLTEEIRQSSS